MTLVDRTPTRSDPMLSSDLEDLVRTAAGQRRGVGARLCVTLPAPLCEPESAFRLLPGGLPFFWATSGGLAFAGAGVAARIEVSGERRLDEMAVQADRLLRDLGAVVHPLAAETATSPRLFGGLSFSVGGADGEPWSGFGDGSLTLPTWLYTRRGAAASLSLTLGEDELEGSALDRRLAETGRVLSSLSGASAIVPGSPPVIARRGDGSQPLAWCRDVEAIRRLIAAGEFEKIVLARRVDLELAEEAKVEELLFRLAELMPTCTRFAFTRGDAVFVGATPERLISRRGSRIRTEALAGSIEGGRDQAVRLRASLKDQGEHSYVVRHIVSRLDPLARRLCWPNEPQIRELRNLLHLETPIEGDLEENVHVLDLVRALHPTPAVGGVPALPSVRWIDDHEPAARGWYAGPVGWLDGNGDGDFAVALRSCLLRGRSAYLWAGGGIVADSDPEAELAETELKLASMLAALGGDRLRTGDSAADRAPVEVGRSRS